MVRQFACRVQTYSLEKRALHTRGPALHTVESVEYRVVAMVSCEFELIVRAAGSSRHQRLYNTKQFCILVQMDGGGVPLERRL